MVTIELRAINVEERILAMCAVGDEAIIWTRPDIDFINFYADHTCGGDGRILKLSKSKIPGLTAYLDQASAEVHAIEGTTCVLSIGVDIGEREFFVAQEAGWPPAPLPF